MPTAAGGGGIGEILCETPIAAAGAARAAVPGNALSKQQKEQNEEDCSHRDNGDHSVVATSLSLQFFSHLRLRIAGD